MTLAEITTRVRERLDETLGSASVRYTDFDVEQRIYECSRWFVARTGCQYATTTITQSAYTLLEDLPCDHIQTERVVWEGVDGGCVLDATHTRDLDATEGWWQRQTDVRSRAYFMLGLRQIALWPESADGGEDYTVHYQQDVPDSLTAVPVEYHEALVYGATGICLLVDQKVDEGLEDYDLFREAIKKYENARSSPDRVWSMRRL